MKIDKFIFHSLGAQIFLLNVAAYPQPNDLRLQLENTEPKVVYTDIDGRPMDASAWDEFIELSKFLNHKQKPNQVIYYDVSK